MNCILCKSHLTVGVVNHIVDLDGHIIIIKGVPAKICGQCGEYFLENDIAIKIEKIIEEVTKNKIEILILKFSEMVA